MRGFGKKGLIAAVFCALLAAAWPSSSFAERFEGRVEHKIVSGDTAAAQVQATKEAKIDALLNAIASVLPADRFKDNLNRIKALVSKDPDRWIASFEVLEEGVVGDSLMLHIACDVYLVALRVAVDEALGGPMPAESAPTLSGPGPTLVLIIDWSGSAPQQAWDLQVPMETALSQRGYEILDREAQSKALQSSALEDALEGDVKQFCPVARALGATYVLIGLTSGNIADSVGVPCIKEAQVRFIHAPSAGVISAIEVRPGDMAGPCQERLSLAGKAVVNRVLDDQAAMADNAGKGVLLEVDGIRHHEDLQDLITALERVPGVRKVGIEYASTGRRTRLRLEGEIRADMLGGALDNSAMPHFRIKLEGVEGNRVQIKCVY